jgi:4-oxalocrotonate tautomerase
MPTLVVNLSHAQEPARYAALAQALTQITAQTLAKRAEVTAVMIDVLPPGRWFIAGQEPMRPTAHLQIHVTHGTNSAQQKADFVQAAYAELAAQLGGADGMELASYVVVTEVDAANWGYGGRTQQYRQQHS